MLVDSDDQPKAVKDRLLSMGSSPYFPVSRLLQPEMYRITRRPETLRPIFSTRLLSMIDGRPEDSVEDLCRKFREHRGLFGMHTEDGFVIPAEWVAVGGCAVCASTGMSIRSGSPVHEMPLDLFRRDIDELHWEISTGETK